MQASPVDQSQSQVAARPFRRRVFYIPGYDPIHPRRYRELYRTEGAEQAAISGYAIDLKPKTTKGPYGWHVSGLIDGRPAEADVEVLVWSDIVRDSMSNTIPATYLQLLRTAWAYIGSGALFRLMRLRKGPMIAALYPVMFLILQLALALGLGYLAARAFNGLADALRAWWLGRTPLFGPLFWAQIFAFFVVWGLAGWLVLRWFRARDNRIFAWYLMHDYAFSAQSGGAYPPTLETRLATFRASLRAAFEQGFDEVLLVGHSSGAHLGVSILADLIRDGVPPDGPALSFLSLGQVAPMVSFLRRAQRLRADLQYLSTREDLTWIDVTAPGDGCAFALCDPVAVTGVAPPGKRWPLVISAAFTQTLSPQKRQALKRRWFRLHFQYLCAFDALPGTPADYDYFRITAGPLTLGQRFAGRPPSKSRIETPVNRFTSVA